MSKFWWFIIGGIVVVTLATINLKKQYPDLVFSFKQESKQQEPKYVIMDGKMIPLTVLSEEDAKKPCKECHIF